MTLILMICDSCELDVTRGGKKCSSCDQTTYKIFKHCLACALEQRVCQICSNDIGRRITPTAAVELAAARSVFSIQKGDAQDAFAKTIEPIKEAVQAYETSCAEAQIIWDDKIAVLLETFCRARLRLASAAKLGRNEEYSERVRFGRVASQHHQDRIQLNDQRWIAQISNLERLGFERFDILTKANQILNETIAQAEKIFNQEVERICSAL